MPWSKTGTLITMLSLYMSSPDKGRVVINQRVDCLLCSVMHVVRFNKGGDKSWTCAKGIHSRVWFCCGQDSYRAREPQHPQETQ